MAQGSASHRHSKNCAPTYREIGNQRDAIRERLGKFCENETLMLQATFKVLWFSTPMIQIQKQRTPRQVNAETQGPTAS